MPAKLDWYVLNCVNMTLVCLGSRFTTINFMKWIMLITSCLCEENIVYYSRFQRTSPPLIIGLEDMKRYTHRTGWLSCLARSGEHYDVIRLNRENGFNVCHLAKFTGKRHTWNIMASVLGKTFSLSILKNLDLGLLLLKCGNWIRNHSFHDWFCKGDWFVTRNIFHRSLRYQLLMSQMLYKMVQNCLL